MIPAIEIAHLSKTFATGRGRAPRRAVDDASLTVMPGELVALIGASGSGKSTLLRHFAGLVAGDRGGGTVSVLGGVVQEAGRLAPDIRRRRRSIGFIFQQFNLVDRLPVLTNVLIGMLGQVPAWRSLLRWFTLGEKQRALAALARMGIGDLAGQRASTLSGGQQQRAAIARALVQGARVILADEPIASLDPEASRRVMEILARINREDGTTIVVSLHQVDYALAYCKRVVGLQQGRIVYDGPSAAVTKELLRELYGSELDDLEAAASDPQRADPRAQPMRDRVPLGAAVEASL